MNSGWGRRLAEVLLFVVMVGGIYAWRTRDLLPEKKTREMKRVAKLTKNEPMPMAIVASHSCQVRGLT